MILGTPAIALRVSPFSRTSRMVTWLTPEYGRLVTSVKGACRPKSAFLGQFDLASRCELLFYRREREGVHVARACAPLAWRPHLRDDWRAAVTAGYLCELTSRVAQPMLDAHALFALLDETLEQIGADDATSTPFEETFVRSAAPAQQAPGGSLLEARVLRFELRLLDILGLGPRLDPCPGCAIDESARHCRFALAAGRLDCIHAPWHRTHDGPSVALTAELLRALRRWREPPAAAACASPIHYPKCNPPGWRIRSGMSQVGRDVSDRPATVGSDMADESGMRPDHGDGQNLAIGMRRFLGMLLQCHLDLPLASRQALFAWLDEPPAATLGE